MSTIIWFLAAGVLLVILREWLVLCAMFTASLILIGGLALACNFDRKRRNYGIHPRASPL